MRAALRPTPPTRGLLVAAGAAAVLALSACGGTEQATSAGAASTTSSDAAGTSAAPETVVVEHAQGETEVPVDPETVVVFDLGVLSTLDVLDAEVAGVPESGALAEQMPDYAGATTVGSLFEPDVEAVAALEPDLIVVAARSAESLPALEGIAPTIDLTVDQTDFLASARERIETLGTIFGEEELVAERLEALDALAAETSEAAADAGTGLVVMTSAGEVSAYGPGSRFGLVHSAMGVTPADEGLSPEASHGDAVSFEHLADTDPDHLFVLDRDAAIGQEATPAAQVLDNPLVAGTTAAQSDDIHYLDSFAWYVAPAGLGSLETMFTEVRDAVA
ncbi:siderophore ABC transporter substrate-binding protein [uncultured Pseudokineococcus sp.]|uniref:siderophore ABC transporter substrate-binding protein n=1 Tax=uncultured Pseudokineococcus sp. TaxID=1642928 RepID=UPI0026188C7C|nr:siderophore ABC transporter substrate-binding protein [uncultured Pseudokineococcus sp.]